MTGFLLLKHFQQPELLRCPGGKIEVAFLVFGRLFLIRYKELLSHPVADFKVVVLCREGIYLNTLLGLGFVSERPEQANEQVLDICENMAQIDVCCSS